MGIFGSLDFASFVPSSTSLVLQTALLAGVIFVFLKFVAYISRYRRNLKLFGPLPGPPNYGWMYGSFMEMRPLDAHERLMKFIEWCNKYSKEKGYFRIWGSLGNPLLVACDPISMKKILKTAEPKPQNITSGYRNLKPWLGDGLLISGGEKWARNRRLLTPAFHFDILKQYMTVYNDSANVMLDKLGKFADDKKEFEIFQHICMLTLDIILRCAFSYEIDVQRSGKTHPYAVAVNDLSLASNLRVRNPYVASDFVYYKTSAGKKFQKDCDFVHSVAEDIINKRRETLKKLGPTKGGKHLDFLDILLTAKDENGVGLSDTDIRSEVDTFLFEGHDTTASAISWILYSLAEHPEYQDKCRTEIEEILLGRESDHIQWSDLPKLEYLGQCIKEGMRLHAPVAIVGRVTTKPFELDGVTAPPGTNVMVNIWALHHNDHVWGNDHMEFRPDRFTRDNVAKMDPYQFVPFSGGPRNCIGQNFAMNEEKVVLAKLLYNFKFSLVPGQNVRKRLSAVMRSEKGILATVERIQHN